MNENWSWAVHQKESYYFRSWYCLGCHQAKPCGVLAVEYCCACVLAQEKNKWREHSQVQKIVAEKQEKWLCTIQELNFLRNYAGCRKCKSLEIDSYNWYAEKKMVCYPCLVKKSEGASERVSWKILGQWYKKRWGINLAEWLEIYNCLPINYACAKKWHENKQHLPVSCDCLEKEAREIHELFVNSWKRTRAKIRNCSCEVSEKVRVDSDSCAKCEGCEKYIPAAKKKRVIKNRNDPRFWGLIVEKKILCLDCIKQNYSEGINSWRKRGKLNEYLKRGYI